MCVCIADDTGCSIRRVDARGADAVYEWTIGEKPAGLSVTGGNVLVTCRDSGRLMMFTKDGVLVQQIPLNVSQGRPCHSVQLAPSRLELRANN